MFLKPVWRCNPRSECTAHTPDVWKRLRLANLIQIKQIETILISAWLEIEVRFKVANYPSHIIALFAPKMCPHQVQYLKWGQCNRVKSFAWIWCLGCMLFHVSPQISSLCACVVALLASKGFLASVGKHMHPQIMWKSTRKTALIASKQFFSSMLPLVYLEMVSSVTWMVTLITSETLLPWMC